MLLFQSALSARLFHTSGPERVDDFHKVSILFDRDGLSHQQERPLNCSSCFNPLRSRVSSSRFRYDTTALGRESSIRFERDPPQHSTQDAKNRISNRLYVSIRFDHEGLSHTSKTKELQE